MSKVGTKKIEKVPVQNDQLSSTFTFLHPDIIKSLCNPKGEQTCVALRDSRLRTAYCAMMYPEVTHISDGTLDRINRDCPIWQAIKDGQEAIKKVLDQREGFERLPKRRSKKDEQIIDYAGIFRNW